jgi:hypothetical protein
MYREIIENEARRSKIMQPLASLYNYQAMKAIELVQDSVNLPEIQEMKHIRHNSVQYSRPTRNRVQRRRLNGLRMLFTRLGREIEAYRDAPDETQSISTAR